LLHASYDRVFQTPAVENLLLASSPLLDAISPSVLRLPVRPGRGNFYEGGVTKAFFGKLRLDANLFRRDFRQYSYDDVLLHTRVRFQAPRHAWLAMGAQYGSGLPADIGNANVSDLLAAFGQQILDRVDLVRGRVRPNFPLDLAAGAEIYHKESRSAALQIQVVNLANRLNVINFASL